MNLRALLLSLLFLGLTAPVAYAQGLSGRFDVPYCAEKDDIQFINIYVNDGQIVKHQGPLQQLMQQALRFSQQKCPNPPKRQRIYVYHENAPGQAIAEANIGQ